MALNEKRKRFANEYLIDLNATQAARRAGYSEKTAASQGQRLLKNAEVASYLQKRRQEMAKTAKVTPESVVEELAKLAFSDLRKVMTPEGNLLPPQDWPDDMAAAIASMEIVQSGRGDDESAEYTHKLKVWDKNSALEKLCKHLGLFAAEKVDVTITHEDRLDGAMDAVRARRAGRQDRVH